MNDLSDMLLCLSSGARPRYREDIIRALSMPTGALLQFRYEKELVESGTFDRTSAQWRVCIAYLDRSDTDKAPSMIPCRLATLRGLEICGDFYVLQLELDEFWDVQKADRFCAVMRAAGTNFPHWKDAKLEGYFVAKIRAVPDEFAYQKTLTEDQLGRWQGLVRSLSARADFRDDCFFYNVRGVFSVKKNSLVAPANGVFYLSSDESYEARIFHYSPQSVDDSIIVGDINWLLVDTVTNAVTVTSNPHIGIDSPYDEKRLRFRTSPVITKQDGIISLYRSPKGVGKPEVGKATWDLDLQIQVVPKRATLFFRGTLIGTLLGLQALVPIWSNSQLTGKIGLSFAVMLLGLVTGWVAAWGLQKPS